MYMLNTNTAFTDALLAQCSSRKGNSILIAMAVFCPTSSILSGTHDSMSSNRSLVLKP